MRTDGAWRRGGGALSEWENIALLNWCMDLCKMRARLVLVSFFHKAAVAERAVEKMSGEGRGRGREFANEMAAALGRGIGEGRASTSLRRACEGSGLNEVAGATDVTARRGESLQSAGWIEKKVAQGGLSWIA